MLIDGHLRAETAGEAVLPVLVLDVSEAEADKLLLTLDPLAAMAERDAERLASLFSEMKERGDSLSSLVWPDYLIDPLVSADWTPPEPGEMPTHEPKEKQAAAPAFKLTEEQRETVDAAIRKYREYAEDESLGDSQCLELICQEYLDR